MNWRNFNPEPMAQCVGYRDDPDLPYCIVRYNPDMDRWEEYDTDGFWFVCEAPEWFAPITIPQQVLRVTSGMIPDWDEDAAARFAESSMRLHGNDHYYSTED